MQFINSRTANLKFGLKLFDLSLQGLEGRVSRGRYGSALAGTLYVRWCCWWYCSLWGEFDLLPLLQLHLQNLFLLLHTSQVRGQLLRV